MQIVIIPKMFEDFFACKIVLAANHLYAENIQRFFCLQNCLRRKSSLSWKQSNTFLLQNCLSCKSSLSWKYSKTFRPQNCLRRKSSISWKHSKIFRLQNCLRRKSSLSRNYSKIFSPARLSWPQTIFMLKIFKNFFASKIVLFANHPYPENIQRLFRLQNCLRRNSSLSWKQSKTFLLQNCLRRKSSLSWKNSKTFSPAKLS